MSEKFIKHEDELSFLKKLTPKDFLDVGMHQVAYIKPIRSDLDHPGCFAIHAADGSRLSVMDSYDTALAAVRLNDLYPVTLH